MQDQTNSIEVTVEELKAKIALRDRLIRLEKNADFKALILNGYFKDKPVQLSKVAAQVTLNEQSQKVWQNAQIGISALQGHLYGIHQEGENAKYALDEHNAELAEGL